MKRLEKQGIHVSPLPHWLLFVESSHHALDRHATMDAPTDRTSPSSAQSPDVSDAPVSGSREPQGQASESLAPESAIFRLTLIEFREELSPAQVEEFSKATVSQVKRKVMEIQSKQEASKELMNLSRLRLFLEQFSNFDSLCKEAEVWGDDAARLSSWIWGPSSWILKVSFPSLGSADRESRPLLTDLGRLPLSTLRRLRAFWMHTASLASTCRQLITTGSWF